MAFNIRLLISILAGAAVFGLLLLLTGPDSFS